LVCKAVRMNQRNEIAMRAPSANALALSPLLVHYRARRRSGTSRPRWESACPDSASWRSNCWLRSLSAPTRKYKLAATASAANKIQTVENVPSKPGCSLGIRGMPYTLRATIAHVFAKALRLAWCTILVFRLNPLRLPAYLSTVHCMPNDHALCERAHACR
jgi:hypothetical protein